MPVKRRPLFVIIILIIPPLSPCFKSFSFQNNPIQYLSSLHIPITMSYIYKEGNIHFNIYNLFLLHVCILISLSSIHYGQKIGVKYKTLTKTLKSFISIYVISLNLNFNLLYIVYIYIYNIQSPHFPFLLFLHPFTGQAMHSKNRKQGSGHLYYNPMHPQSNNQNK